MAGALLGGRLSLAAEAASGGPPPGQAAAATSAQGAAPAQPGTPAEAAKQASHVVDSQIVSRVHGFNQMGIRAGKMAESHSQSKAVRDFGATLIKDHEAADKKLLAFAKQAKIDPNAMTTAMAGAQAQYGAQLDRLGLLSGATFDRGFTTTMVDWNANAIGTFSRARSGITDPKLNALLGNMLPMLYKHQHRAAELSAQKPTASNEP